ncbi:hypothetical protein RFI_34996 [Reticulomyxa filosa]|uniref:TLDc domain-containing protein n=1 Tax=Reticulomyxa filosa TaxID=46433 RepID=X6LNZ6_RETFI|nr:hypothetical protein RFI_34996 [Reticulomyxa filosa]|eukprot:ETO02435.1 hypothetical protein RFI_34996 [Reticulomyxa filosa]
MVLIQWNIKNKQNISKYQLEILKCGNDNINYEWEKIKEFEIVPSTSEGSLVLCHEEIAWENTYKLRIHGFCKTKCTVTQYSPEFLLYVSQQLMESRIIKNGEVKVLLSLLPKNKTIRSLLYCASRDGFNTNAFHFNCNRKGKTVVIVKAKDRVFGGYTTVSWWNRRGGNTNTYDKDAFLFLLRNDNSIVPQKFHIKKGQEENAILGNCGPCFGK